MATPMDVNARHGDESQSAQRMNRSLWVWVALVALVVIAAIIFMMRAGTGPGANQGRVAADTSHVEGGVAPGVGSTYAGQPGGRPDGTPSPNPNAGNTPAQ